MHWQHGARPAGERGAVSGRPHGVRAALGPSPRREATTHYSAEIYTNTNMNSAGRPTAGACSQNALPGTHAKAASPLDTPEHRLLPFVRGTS